MAGRRSGLALRESVVGRKGGSSLAWFMTVPAPVQQDRIAVFQWGFLLVAPRRHGPLTLSATEPGGTAKKPNHQPRLSGSGTSNTANHRRLMVGEPVTRSSAGSPGWSSDAGNVSSMRPELS